MGESVGHIFFINRHDYLSDVMGTQVIGCMAFLRTGEVAEVVLYTRELRLQHTLEMADATKSKVTVNHFDVKSESAPDQRRSIDTAARGGTNRPLSGPFNLKAIWTVE